MKMIGSEVDNTLSMINKIVMEEHGVAIPQIDLVYGVARDYDVSGTLPTQDDVRDMINGNDLAGRLILF